MKRLFWVLLLLSGSAWAQSGFNGTWKADLKTAQMGKKPDVYVLKDGMYECKTCMPPYKVKADGKDQSVSGHPYFDSINVTVVNDHETKEVDKKNGKVVNESTVTVAPDGKTATVEFTDSSNSNAKPVSGKVVITKVAPGPAGSHATSGSWRTTGFDTISDNGLLTTYKVEGNNLSMSSPTGQSYTAPLDGKQVDFKGDPGITKVSVKKLGPNTVEETDYRDSKVIGVAKMTVSADGKKMNVVYEDKMHGNVSHYTADKQ
jgi:hypothetical protein